MTVHSLSSVHRARSFRQPSRWAVRTLCLLISTCLAGQAMAQTVPQSTYQYDAQGHPTRQIDPLGHTTEQSWNGLGLPTEQRLPHPTSTGTQGKIQTTYDGQGQIKSVTDPKGLATTYTTDGLGNTTALASPDTGTSQYQYDAAGNLTQKTDARGKTATYTYDASNRLTQIVYGDQTVTYTYDEGTGGKGQMTGMTDASGTTRWTFDAQGRLSTRSQARAGQSKVLTTRYQYDTQGRLASMTYPSGRLIAYAYNAAGQIKQISLDGQAQLKQITWQAFGPVKSWVWAQAGTDKTVEHQYDLNGRPTALSNGQGTRQITWDDASRLTKISEQTGATVQNKASATYDNLDRLTQNVTPLGTDTYQYDANGNRTAQAHDSQSTTHTVSATSNRINASTGADARSYQYDAAGNITADGQATYVYDHSGRLTRLTCAGQTTTYTYNGLGQRLTKQSSGTTTTPLSEFVYDESGHLIGEYDANNQPIQEHIWLGDTPVLMAAGSSSSSEGQTPPPVAERRNWALSSEGAVGSASSTFNGPWAYLPITAINDGDRTGKNWGQNNIGSGWNDNTEGQYPDWVQIDLRQSHTIDQINVITASDATGTSEVKEPTLSDTFNQNGITDFDVQVWSNNAWQTVPGGEIRGNHNIWRQINFPAVQTDKVRITIYAASNRPGNDFSRIIELEALGNNDGTPPIQPVESYKNWALPIHGGIASASSVKDTYNPIEAINDGAHTGANWSQGQYDSGWRSQPDNHFPEWAQITFDQPHAINRIAVYNPQDGAGVPIWVEEPTADMTFTRYGATDFDVQYFDAGTQNWQTVPNGTVHNNNKVWREFTFPAVTTNKVRVVVNGALPGIWGDVRAGLVELEAWGEDNTTPTPPPTPTSGMLYQVYADQIDTPRSLIDSSTGKTVWTWEGEAFGNTQPDEDPQQSGNTTTYNLRFPGQYYDQESKLFYNYFRDYSPSTGRYVQSDPIGLQGGVNTYSYVEGNPVRGIDPYGLFESHWILRVVVPGQSAFDNMMTHIEQGNYGQAALSGTASLGEILATVASFGEYGAIKQTVQCSKGLGDLTSAEVRQIQRVVNEAGRPLEIGGSAATGTRRGVGTNLPIGKGPGTRSDIDYLIPPSSAKYYEGLQSKLPGIDPKTGAIPASGNSNIGPFIRFEPK